MYIYTCISHCNALHHTAPYCNTLQCTATIYLLHPMRMAVALTCCAEARSFSPPSPPRYFSPAPWPQYAKISSGKTFQPSAV